ncbi:winged helix-turn-helix transcriptional regulator [Tunturiibacter gelidiferens]|uniref:winged helix-turn-helix transcriptional regulator n=1 Tax=Tunturiibacter gelidiferens TaxID=3069689 RepID=UPI003D9B2C07
MRDGPVRLGRLGRVVPATRKVLTENLRKLESAGLIPYSSSAADPLCRAWSCGGCR